jgi:uncharacterized protein
VNLAQHILIFGVRVYRWVFSPAKIFVFGPGSACRFSPSCSQYALDAVASRGAMAGALLGIKRVCRCHPWGGCGYDPIPKGKSEARNPKSETNSKHEIRNSKAGASAAVPSKVFGTADEDFGVVSEFEFRGCFGFRISDFGFRHSDFRLRRR